jgi:hypothetical protein
MLENFIEFPGICNNSPCLFLERVGKGRSFDKNKMERRRWNNLNITRIETIWLYFFSIFLMEKKRYAIQID